MGIMAPFTTVVRNVCASCNNRWMSDLEGTAKRVLSPHVLGQSDGVDFDDRVAVSLWAHKTALVSMLLSSEEERRRGHGLPPGEYSAFFDNATNGQLLPRTSTWIGRYSGELRLGATRVVPVIVRFPGLPDPDVPDGYVFTVVVGGLLIMGLRFTSRTPAAPMRQAGVRAAWLAPSSSGPVNIAAQPIGDEDFLAISAGSDLRLTTPGVALVPWSPASDLPRSRTVGDQIALPVMCGLHTVFYPSLLAAEAIGGRLAWFMTSCECGVAYLIRTESTGAHARAADTPAEIAARYEALPGREFEIVSPAGRFFCKEDHSGSSFRRRR